MDGSRRGAGPQISLAAFYQSTTDQRLTEIKKEVADVAPWLVRCRAGFERVQRDRVGPFGLGHERVANEGEHSTVKSIPNSELWRTV